MILGTQLDLAVATETALYAPPADTGARVEVIFCNRNNAITARVRLVHRPTAAATQPENYVTYDKGVPPSDERRTDVFDVANPEELLVYSDVANISVTCNGIERTI